MDLSDEGAHDLDLVTLASIDVDPAVLTGGGGSLRDAIGDRPRRRPDRRGRGTTPADRLAPGPLLTRPTRLGRQRVLRRTLRGHPRQREGRRNRVITPRGRRPLDPQREPRTGPRPPRPRRPTSRVVPDLARYDYTSSQPGRYPLEAMAVALNLRTDPGSIVLQ